MIESIKYITGNRKSLKIQGPTKIITAFQSALKASRNLYKSLQNEGTDLLTIESLVRKKSSAAKEYFKISGSKWPF